MNELKIYGELPEGSQEYSSTRGNVKLTVYWEPAYVRARSLALEKCSGENHVLEPDDFWVIKEEKEDFKMHYTGLALSHKGCLKLNQSALPENQFKASKVTIDKEGYGNTLAFIYCDEEKNILEIGEVSKDNCSFDYPYCMANKRCFDRVVIKLNNFYEGIFGEDEAQDFSKENAISLPPVKPVEDSTAEVVEDKKDIANQEVQETVVDAHLEDDIDFIDIDETTDTIPEPVKENEPVEKVSPEPEKTTSETKSESNNVARAGMLEEAEALLKEAGKLESCLAAYKVNALSDLNDGQLVNILDRCHSGNFGGDAKTKKDKVLEDAIKAFDEADVQSKPKTSSDKELDPKKMLFSCSEAAPSEIKKCIGMPIMDLPDDILKGFTCRKNAVLRKFCDATILAALDAVALTKN